ncbi:MAG: hypothetical protein GY777_23410 [Candidatus Brocadiaceae bacterium]|nr:hypothetical protein [Candidatus Brocadiaceae bacterium]
MENGKPGAAMTIHTFGNYAENFHLHIHAIVSDGLFRETDAKGTHFPEKSFQMIRYYGWYPNKSRGVRKKQGILKPGEL